MTSPAHTALDALFLTRQTFGDRALERELLRLFDQQCRRLLPVIARSDGGLDRRDAAHALKGAARAIGANRVAALADTIELAFEQCRPRASVDRLAAKLALAIEEARAAMGEL